MAFVATLNTEQTSESKTFRSRNPVLPPQWVKQVFGLETAQRPQSIPLDLQMLSLQGKIKLAQILMDIENPLELRF